MHTLGICFGATTLQAVLLYREDDVSSVERTWRIHHEGNPQKALQDLLAALHPVSVDRIAVTGRGFRHKVALSSISEPQAIEEALRAEFADGAMPDLVLSLGGETQLAYRIGARGAIVSVHSGNKCASGTGEFFVQQIRRMGLSVDEAVGLAREGQPHKIAGRCSVFCKSDCTHALNKGESRANVAAGLCSMMADKISDIVKDMPCESVAVIGGGVLNGALMQILRQRYRDVRIADTAPVFEAYGAALWASCHPCRPLPESFDGLVVDRTHSFGFHRPLNEAVALVERKERPRGRAASGDRCVLGLDVGSTTTKAALVRIADRAIVASVYLRTNGDPVEAARQCYADIDRQISGIPVDIRGLGVTGSGRRIAALHAMTGDVINEIIAHATAAAFFDPEVDTIFEIGGQDAKYTHLTAGVPSDYAMNEACSAGTGSFLEEASRESLNVPTEEIGAAALQGPRPPDFTDQCAAFISSDIKRAAQEGVGRNDILAGLVYSICLNYLNRVKGMRPVGTRVFMQGGVCYNEAVPVAMAALMQRRIIVPPDPGLMGAFGVALEVLKRIEAGQEQHQAFSLAGLASRTAAREGVFTCAGGAEKCDRKCEIARIRVDGKVYPFGGVCSRYYNTPGNAPEHAEAPVGKFDFVRLRQRLVWDTHARYEPEAPAQGTVRTVGIPRSFLAHSLMPMYSHFFSGMGFRVIAPDEIDPEGVSRTEAPYCLPAELSHGAFTRLLKSEPDHIFVPQVMQIPVPNVPTYSRLCVFVQGEPYYLRTTFRKELESSTSVMLTPVLRMEKGYQQAGPALLAVARQLGVSEPIAQKAFHEACEAQRACDKDLRKHGKEALHYLEKHPHAQGIVVFGRPYNAFAPEANMGIAHKIASRGVLVIPLDMLPADGFNVDRKMFWATGQRIMKAAQYVKLHDNLFGVYITNFSCGPDSFLLGYFRTVMGDKPSLTLELDQHTADAGIDTRIEAALDIFAGYRGLAKPVPPDLSYRPAQLTGDKEPMVVDSRGVALALTDPRVEVVVPSMGHHGAEALAAVLRSRGVRARALPIPDKETLLDGRRYTSGKECLPYILTTGSFMQYLTRRTDPEKVTLCFMATGGGPCRLGQYCRALEDAFHRNRVRNAAVLTLSDENGYAGLGSRALLRAWQAIVCSDVFGDIENMLAVTARHPAQAREEFDACWREVVAYFGGRLSVRFTTLLTNLSARLSRIPLARSPGEVPVVSLLGEIFVRREEFSRKNIVGYLQDHGFMVKVAPVGEYLCYGNYVIHRGLGEREFTVRDRVKMRLTVGAQEWWERRIKTIAAASGLYRFEMIDVAETIEGVKHLVNENFRGECILTIGLAMREILNDSCGVISIGPFGCMPSRMAEAVLKKEMTAEGKARMPGWDHRMERLADAGDLPFLAIETDGSPFPQLVEANLEAFVLRARRVHESLAGGKPPSARRESQLVGAE